MGIQEILIIAVVLLVLFGAKRIPEMMKGIGKGINDFKSEKNKPSKDDESVKNN
jgi:sec-independent protein translocase protein TatA